jgi:hypothetical protein
MLKTKPVEIILTLSHGEIKELTAFVRSPYFNTNKNLAKFFEVIKKNLKKVQADKFTEEDAYTEIFPGKEYNYGIMKNLVSGLASVCEEFLIMNSVRTRRQNYIRSRVLLADEYDSRYLDQHHHKVINKTVRELDAQLMDNFYYSDRALVEEAKYFFHSSRSDDKSLEAAVYDETIYNVCDFYRKFSRSMWKIYNSMSNSNSAYEMDFIRILSSNINFRQLAESMKGINEKEYSYIILNTLLIKLLVDSDHIGSYFELKELLVRTIDRYENYEKFSILTKVISYCSRMFKSGHYDFMHESLDLRIMVMEKVRFNFEGQGAFNFHSYIETVLMICTERSTQEAEEFLNRHIDSVSADKAELCRSLCMAYICEARGENSKAIKFLVKTPHIDNDIKIWVKRLYISIYYNTNEFEAGLDAVNAFRGFIGGKDFTGYSRKRYTDYAKVMEKMIKIKCSPEQYSAGDLESLYNEVNLNNNILKRWQLEKIADLKKIIPA